jgi:pimeloyl-ACP methyl ester carboxylesterase
MQARTAGNLLMEYDDTGSGIPVVLLHAFPLDRQMWRSQVAALADRYRLIVPDQRGFGGTGGFTGTPSIAALADDAAGLLDAIGVREPVVLAGLSMGGYVALAFARAYPGRLRGLVLADTRSGPDTAEGKANRDKLIEFTRTHTAADVIGLLLPKMVSDETRSRRPEVVAEVKRIASAQTPDGIIGALQALRDRPDAGPWLGAIRAPTLVVVGTDDQLTPVPTAEALAAAIPGARLEKIQGAGHLSNLERPDEFNAALRSFLGGLAR